MAKKSMRAKACAACGFACIQSFLRSAGSQPFILITDEAQWPPASCGSFLLAPNAALHRGAVRRSKRLLAALQSASS